MKKLAMILGTAALLGGLFVLMRAAKATKTPAGGPPQAAVVIRVAPVERCTMRDVRKFTGSLLPRSQFIVAPKVAGRLEKLLVEMGDSVRRNQLIAVLDSQEYAQEVEQARAELKVAKANVAECESSRDVAERELERVAALREKKVASESELDSAGATHRACLARHSVSLAQVEQKEAALKAAEVRLSFTEIRASWQGGSESLVVGERYVDAGTMLRGNDSIVSLLDVDPLTAVIHVTEEDYSKVRGGQSVVLTTNACAGRRFPGTVARMAPALKETSRAARVEVEVPNRERLLAPGLFVQAEIELARRDGATTVPLVALAKRNGKQGVFLLEQEAMKARFIPVQTGILTAESAEIVQPHLAGQVVTLGQHLLDDGSSVMLPETGSGSGSAGKASSGAGAGGRP